MYHLTEILCVICGAPQGSNLGPLRFSLYGSIAAVAVHCVASLYKQGDL